jgi:hypothetical protein
VKQLLLILLLLFTGILCAQEYHSNEFLRVFMDCDDCDMNRLREEVKFIHYVRDRELADVHVFVDEMGTGGGGVTYSIAYIGKGAFEGSTDTLRFIRLPIETYMEYSEGLHNTILMGLMPYVARTSVGRSIRITFDQDDINERTVFEQPTVDPWNYWVFEIDAGGDFQKETYESDYSIRSGFEARRITEEWKTEAEFYQRFRSRTVNQDEDVHYINYKVVDFDFDLVKSLGDHWAAGISGDASSNTSRNRKLLMGLFAAVEFSLFPYREVSRREVTLSYHIGMDHQSYFEETIYLKMNEYLPRHDLEFDLRFNQPWGYARTSLNLSQYLNDPSKFYIGFNGRMRWRIYKGLTVNLGGSYGIVRNQVYLARNEATYEEILLKVKRIKTDFEFDIYFGFGYTFGSLYNNVVNPRL